MAIGFLRDPNTGRLMSAEDFARREKDEWKGAFGTLFKECLGAGKKQRDQLFLTSEQDIKKLMASAHNFKRR